MNLRKALSPEILFERYEAYVKAKGYSDSGLKLVKTPRGYRIDGHWWVGNSYGKKGKEYHGGFPGDYIDRIYAMFPPADFKTLHAFSGSIPPGDYYRLDKNPRCVVGMKISPRAIIGDLRFIDKETKSTCADLHTINPKRVLGYPFDVMHLDPPYAVKDAENEYDVPMVKRQVIFKQSVALMRPGGVFTWLDQIPPLYSNKDVRCIAAIGMIISTNHRWRGTMFFQKV